ncbi:hypothetical protein MAHJHV55_44640 [Mycobacterium avium subsp. hominissuis]
MVEGEVAVIDITQAAEADYNLSPSRWVSSVGAVDKGDIGELLTELDLLSNEDVGLTTELLKLLAPLAKVRDAK